MRHAFVHWKTALFAALLALLSRWLIALEITTEATVEIPLRLRLPSGVVEDVEKPPPPRRLIVTVRGPRDQVESFGREVGPLDLDLGQDIEAVGADAQPRTIDKRIDPTAIEVPRRVRLIRLHPEKVTVSIDFLVVKALTVSPPEPEDAPAGHDVHIAVSPSVVSRLLPSRKVSEITEIKTTPLRLEGRTGRFEDRRQLVDPLTGETLQEWVDLTVTVMPREISRAFDSLPVRILQAPDLKRTVTVEPERITVRLSGRADMLSTLDPSRIIAYTEIGNEPPGKYERLPTVVPIEGVRVESVTKITVTIQPAGP